MEPSHCGIRIADWGFFLFTLGNLAHFRHLYFFSAPVLAPLNVLDSFIGMFLAVIHMSRINIRLHGLFNWGGAVFLWFVFGNTF
jgi:hypothetical protein